MKKPACIKPELWLSAGGLALWVREALHVGMPTRGYLPYGWPGSGRFMPNREPICFSTLAPYYEKNCRRKPPMETFMKDLPPAEEKIRETPSKFKFYYLFPTCMVNSRGVKGAYSPAFKVGSNPSFGETPH
jgi:hypothetical protein